nr:immunoglobulin light chain junction region [Macaca mulatta]
DYYCHSLDTSGYDVF